MRLSDFEALTFDCYGTLIDWESGIWNALAPLRARVGAAAGMGLSRAGIELSRDDALQAFARLEARQQEKTPAMPYPEVLAEVHGQLAVEWDVAPEPEEDATFGRSIADWPAFPDTVEALRYLKQHFRLVVLSNVDRAGFEATRARLGVAFDAVYTAQDIGSYKPDMRNFRYLLERLREQGVEKGKVLHVAQSLFHDHVPANAIGLASAWIDRRGDAGGATAAAPGDVRYDFRFESLGELAEAHRADG
jgi:2-haloacid dehalogenase